jgi:ABC-type transport system involved in cytochrome c biogenesis ATPase subunit
MLYNISNLLMIDCLLFSKHALREFFPTSVFLSLLNEQHEILIGSRGSGKTTLLRMLSYSCLKQINHPKTIEAARARKFIAFYVPLNLEWIASLPATDADGTGRIEYFQFAFNCKAVQSFLAEVKELIRDLVKSPQERLAKEAQVISRLASLWLQIDPSQIATLEEMSWQIEKIFSHWQAWKDGCATNLPYFAKHLFAPILSALPYLSRDLGIDFETTHWLACVDEAEFLKAGYIQCFNSFMRSEKRPIVLKLATMPFKYLTTDTTIPGLKAEANGNDFNFRPIDMSWDANDFILLTNHMIDCRVSPLGLSRNKLTLENFVGQMGADDPKDYYRTELADKKKPADDETILAGILESLSHERRDRFERIKSDKERVASDYFKKYSPVWYVRTMYAEDSRGNATVGWFAGPAVIRKIADGNPRRFIQLMHDLFERARQKNLTPKEQHRVLTEFVDRDYERAAGLPDYGPFLQEILNTLDQQMANRVHGREMMRGGVNFEVQPALINNPLLKAALQLGIAYSFLFVDQNSLLTQLSEKSDFRVSHVVAVKFWSPMSKGDRIILRSPHARDHLAFRPMRAPSTIRESKTALGNLQLNLFSTEEE